MSAASSSTDQRIDPPLPNSNDRLIGPPSSATVAQVHVSRLIINADQVETKTVPKQQEGGVSLRPPDDPPQWQQQSRPTLQRRHSASELAAVAVIPIVEPAHLHHNTPSRPEPQEPQASRRRHASDRPQHRREHQGRPRRNGGEQGRVQQLREGRSSLDKLQSRCCWMCLLFPVLMAAGFMALGVATFSVMDYKVRKSCTSLSCSISCYNTSGSTFLDCDLVYTGAGLSLLLSSLFASSIAIRICCGLKVLTSCLVCELFLHLLNMALCATVSVTMSLDTDYNKSCLKYRCGDSVDVLDVINFMNQAKVGAWLSSIIMVLIVFLWILLGLKTCLNSEVRIHRQSQDGERQRLIDS